MIFLLDTNILSQSAKLAPHPGAKAFLSKADEASTSISVISITELTSGIHLLPVGRKRESLQRWLDTLVCTHKQRTLVISPQIAINAGQINARARKAGSTPELGDILLAATAQVHGLRLVTLNHKHFVPLGVDIAPL